MDDEAIIKYPKHFRADNTHWYFLKMPRVANVHAKGSQTVRSFGKILKHFNRRSLSKVSEASVPPSTFCSTVITWRRSSSLVISHPWSTLLVQLTKPSFVSAQLSVLISTDNSASEDGRMKQGLLLNVYPRCLKCKKFRQVYFHQVVNQLQVRGISGFLKGNDVVIVYDGNLRWQQLGL